MNILHFSDLHGKLPQIPKKWRNSDTVVVLSGDICDNYPDSTFTPGYKNKETGEFEESNWNSWNFRKIDVTLEGELQDGWVSSELIPHLNKNDIAFNRVVILKGNHDFGSFEKFFNNGLDIGTKVVMIENVKFGLLTGVLPYVNEWNDEVDDSIIAERVKELPRDIDILVTHVPTYNIRDYGGNYEKIGSPALYKAIFNHEPYFTHIRYHLFGHAHGQHGVDKHEVDGSTVRFVNGAQQRMPIDLKPAEW